MNVFYLKNCLYLLLLLTCTRGFGTNLLLPSDTITYKAPLNLSITFDKWPEETSWDIKIGDSTIVQSANYQLYGDDKDDTSITIPNLDLVPAMGYVFHFYDAFVDGICCFQGNGVFTLTDAEGAVVFTGNDFQSELSQTFHIEGDLCSNGLKDGGEEGIDCGPTCTPCIIGCTDQNSHNYNINAQIDDGNCETCGDNILNGDEIAMDCGGSLCAPCIEGCMDENAHNYIPEAQVSSGDCETCNDNVQNSDEAGIDCGGARCVPCDPSSYCDQDTYTTDSNITSDIIVAVNQSINAGHKVESNLNVAFQAGQEILLGPGFEIALNTQFEAIIGGCPE